MEQATTTLEDLTSVRKRLQIEVPADTVRAETERVFAEVGRRARLPGFRPGKAPRAVLERAFGDEVRREVLGRLLERSFAEAVESHGLNVVGSPDLDLPSLSPGEALRYSVTVEVRPTITVGSLEGLEAVRPSAEVTDADVDRVIDRLRDSVAQLRPVEDRSTVESGDVLSVTLTSRLGDAEPVRREDVLLEAGTGAFPLALERQLVGQHRGAHLSLRVPYPSDYANPGLAGKTVDFEVEIRELRLKELPPLDDDFARDHGRAESLDALRARIRTELEREAAERADEAVRHTIVDQLISRHPFDVPPSLVDRRAEAIVASLPLRLPEGAERDQAVAELRAQMRPRAEHEIRAELLLDAVAAREGVGVTEEDVRAEMEAMARRGRIVIEQVRALYDRPEAQAALKAKLVRDRALAGLIAAARVMPSASAESIAHEK
jgi:trigger factor